jgi:putative copper export protein
MLPVTWDVVRLSLHVLGAAVWVGGQITLLYLLPTVRGLGEAAPAAVARRFNQLAWGGFVLLLVTGVWHLLAIDVGDRSTAYHATLGLKLLVVAISAGGVAVHIIGRSKAALAIGGALGFVGALAALFLGVQLHG